MSKNIIIINSYIRNKVMAVIGVQGVGKTATVIQTIDQMRERGDNVAFICEKCMGFDALKKDIVKQLIPGAKNNIGTADVDAILNKMKTSISGDKRVIIIIDNAHQYSDVLLKQIYSEFNRPFYLILVGRAELKEMIERNKLDVVYNQIDPMNCKDTEEYIWFRLTKAGYPTDKPNPFKDCIQEIFEATGGIPRKINILCEKLLEIGQSYGVRIISKEMVGEAKEVVKL